jgi:LysM repeat protein
MTPRRAARTLAILVTLAAVLTAGAPSVIRIEAGDSLWEIARRHHTTVATLRALNDLPGNGTIYAGALLKVPSSRGGTPASRRVETSYQVRPGDNLTAIARRHGVSVQTLIVRNGLPRNGMIVIGRHLAVPGQARRAATSAPAATVNAGARIPGSVQRSVAAHRATLAGRPQPSRATVRALVATTARRHGVDPSLALAVAYQESGFQQAVVSPVDAIGVMQVLPSTGRALNSQYGRRLDLLRVEDNVTAGVLLLQQLVRGTGRTDRALAGYYQGLGSIQAQGMLPQTHAYVRNVSALRARFRNG